ncbi:hypothetical protein HGRIS_003663 [Hohenbuehelia grisea]|uniref:UBX domain-containing protein n=1 Tax=Hohenbuehelia grisea TaxID=104357 RepID=A0ABR3JG48_9AGAR
MSTTASDHQSPIQTTEVNETLAQKETATAGTHDILDQDFHVYRPAEGGSSIPALPDSYFVPTAADLKAAQDTLSARTRALVDAPLQTRAVREANETTKRAKWPNTTIRVKFPDRTQLEKVFLSTDKIRSVYAFVRPLLREDVRPIKFILYQSPPKRDLKVSDPQVRNLSLAELQLAPSSILLLRFEDEALNASTIPAPLLPSVLNTATDLPIPRDVSDLPGSSQPEPTSTTSQKVASTVKVPKWLKLGNKK